MWFIASCAEILWSISVSKEWRNATIYENLEIYTILQAVKKLSAFTN
jgi:hypothetical protein